KAEGFHDDDHAGVGSRRYWAAEIGIDLCAILARIVDHVRSDFWRIHRRSLRKSGPLVHTRPRPSAAQAIAPAYWCQARATPDQPLRTAWTKPRKLGQRY